MMLEFNNHLLVLSFLGEEKVNEKASLLENPTRERESQRLLYCLNPFTLLLLYKELFFLDDNMYIHIHKHIEIKHEC